MKCPTCNVALAISERQGIEIDYCPTCRGVWLDRGELDKIIERTSTTPQGTTARPTPYTDDDEDRSRHSNDATHGRGYERKRENPIADLFDFF